jgi:hypothetical protein
MKKQPGKFEKLAQAQSGGNFFSDLWAFLKTNKKWWLAPLIIFFLIFALLVGLSGTGLAPFIYTLF